MAPPWTLLCYMKNLHRLVGIAALICVTCIVSFYLMSLGQVGTVVEIPASNIDHLQRSHTVSRGPVETVAQLRNDEPSLLNETRADTGRAVLNLTTTEKGLPKTRTTTIKTPTERNISNFFDSKDEIRHIAFLKVHKAASSTVQNIFLRFGSERNLTFVLPPVKNPSGYPNIISLHEPMNNKNILAPPPGKHFDILCNHVYYSYESFTDIMPVDTVFIGIVREPFELYKSILNYFRPVYIYKKIPGPSPVSQFLQNPAKFEPKGRISNSWTNNRMAQEFGFPSALFSVYDKNEVQKIIKRLDREFQLVLVAELMDESLLMMRRKLHWQHKDILYISQNIASKKNISILPEYSESKFYKQYARIDYDIYRHFYMKLRDEIRKEGPDFDEELLVFIELRRKVNELCKKKVIGLNGLNVPGSPWGKPFHVTPAMCDDMKRGEMKYTEIIRERQYGTNTTDLIKSNATDHIKHDIKPTKETEYNSSSEKTGLVVSVNVVPD